MHATKSQTRLLQTIKKRSDFIAAREAGKSWVSRGLIIQARENHLGVMRAGLTVTKRTDKSAVVRNRIKRRLRAVAADVLPQNAKGDYDYVLIGRAETRTRPYEQLCRDLKWCLKKMDLLA